MKKILIIIHILLYNQIIAQDLQFSECYIDNTNEIKICIAADSTTYDKLFGFGFRILHVANPKDSSEVFRHEMEVNYAVDFAYFLNTNFVEEHNIVIIQGVRSYYLYNLEKQILSEQVKIDYKGCNFSDAQGSYIGNFNILLDGKVLQLQIKECGIRQYDIENIKEIKEIKLH